MAYENINVSRLQSDLTKLKQIVTNKNKLDRVANSLNSAGWEGNSRNQFKKAMKTTTNYHNQIIKYIERFQQAAGYIKQYQDIQKNKKEAANNAQNQNSKLKGMNKKDSNYDSVKNNINRYNNEVNSCNQRLSELQQKIESLIN